MDRLSLYRGRPFNILDKIYVKHPTLGEIEDLGYTKYSEYLHALTVRPVDIADILWFDMKIWYEQVTPWNLFLQLFQTDKVVAEALSWFTGCEFTLMIDEHEHVYLYCEELNISINEHFFMQIVHYLREINFIPEKSDLQHAGNKKTAVYMMEQVYKKRKRQSKDRIDLASIASAVDWIGNSVSDIWELPIYRVYEGYMRINMRDNYQSTLSAYYAGNIDTTKSKIDFEKINWSNIITLE